MKWLKNLENIANKKSVGRCPICNSYDTDYTLVGKIGSVGFGEVWCNDCKNAYHMSRIKILEGYNLNKKVPDNLKYWT